MLLAKIVDIVVSPVLDLDTVDKLDVLLQKHHRSFCKTYDKWKVTINYHMCLHIPDMILDLGPPHAFWCFGYERLNGILAGTPNSNRRIEAEVTNRFLRDTSIAITDPVLSLKSTIPKALSEFVDSTECSSPPYPLTFWILRKISSDSAPEERFQKQMAIDEVMFRIGLLILTPHGS